MKLQQAVKQQRSEFSQGVIFGMSLLALWTVWLMK